MVKNVLGVAHVGVRDWKIQRVSVIYMAFFTLGLLMYVVTNPDLSFAQWHSLFAATPMKIATALFALLLLMHTWVGIWTINTDYVKVFPVRVVLNTLVAFVLAACFFWALSILWSV